MNKSLSIFSLIVILCSCSTSNYMPGFDFKLFKNTPVSQLATAVAKEDTEQMETILKDTSIKVDYHEPKFGNTLLMLAVVNNKQKSVKKLLEVGANPKEKDYYDNATSLIYACEYHLNNCDTSILKMLIEQRANVNVIQNIDRVEDNCAHSFVKTTPLMIAAKTGCLNIIQTLLNSGAAINAYTYYEGYGTLSKAITLSEQIACAQL
ncbi:MAG TPA: ankyrin repeat domain-containing protein [Hanamia sp.]|nr:ankyrin repeat domain-containing protein [Hanamia sp.]